MLRTCWVGNGINLLYNKAEANGNPSSEGSLWEICAGRADGKCSSRKRAQRYTSHYKKIIVRKYGQEGGELALYCKYGGRLCDGCMACRGRIKQPGKDGGGGYAKGQFEKRAAGGRAAQ